MFDTPLLIVIAGVFVLAGFVKGVVGLGLPTVSLGILTAVIGLPQAMALMIVPAFLTNVWQAMAGGGAHLVLRRIRLFLLLATLTVWIGALALTRMDLNVLAGLLGALLILYALTSLAGLRITVPKRHEPWLGPLTGAVNGVLTGMTGAYAVPGVMYLQGLGLTRDQFIQAMGMLFLGSTVALGLALGASGIVPPGVGIYSVLAVIPALSGVWLGQRVRRRLSEAQFRRLFFLAILGLGGYIAFEAVRAGL
ncbi:sulfite exporter TauE/SafE family protein [Breoghania sp. L-A4]|uniref:sulfite exporter TauE/SafE family protein n=1 Tax=Breoghania sp. L-A4 TaxID=2304600 RepID=UPI000E35D0DF|nr:sulfite exporter TauE/SafE family protein [Breoghania sp. L-A4]AXS42757.1 sulfite exporter TauE/SafE family protein [Breoghania sp. L-A4]